MPAYRPTVNQPTGYNSSLYGYQPIRRYRCHRHDYTYYATDWTDNNTGRSYNKGFYDESGNYYRSLIMDNNGSFETRVVCDYCGSDIKLVWKEGAIPSCPNCGANMREIVEGAAVDTEYKETDNLYSGGVGTGNNGSALKTVLKVLRIYLVVIFVVPILYAVVSCGALLISGKRLDDIADVNDKNNDSLFMNKEYLNDIRNGGTGSDEDQLYVESIGRYIYWSDEYDSYYDEESDCYVYYNEDMDPPVWQYWYEDISSDYGDYGWMEYEENEDLWYIEVGEGEWEKLPSKYDTDDLWHFEGEQAGTSYAYDLNLEMFGEEIKVENAEGILVWDEDMMGYYNQDADCYIWYNTYVDPYIWQYWYPDISSDYGYYGWMEYDEAEDIWYIEEDMGEWIPVPDEYDTSELWHIEGEVSKAS